MRRRCPFGDECSYRREWGVGALAEHEHVWTFPVGPLVMGLVYDRTMFSEHAGAAGLAQRPPRDWEEMLRWARLMTDPARSEFGFFVHLEVPSWEFVSLLYSAGGRVVEQDQRGNWRCLLESDAAVEAAYFFARLRLEKVERDGRTYRGVIGTASGDAGGPARYAMRFDYLDDRFLAAAADRTRGIGPVPAGPGGTRGSEFNAMMCGIFAGLADEPAKRDIAWDYIQFFDGTDARRIRTEMMVEAGLGSLVRRRLLTHFNDNGRYDAILRSLSPELEETYRIAFDNGVPEPYGRNCQYIYEEMNKPIGAIWNSAIVQDAIDRNDPPAGKAQIRRILQRATQRIDEKMLGNLPPHVQKRQNRVAWIVIAAVAAVFALMFRRVLRTFSPATETSAPIASNPRRRRRYTVAYLLMLPAIGSIALWLYWPLARGTIIAFQDYSVIGDSEWVGAGNFASVLFNPEFWYSLRLALIYALLFLFFGFWVPIALAFLLQEVPMGKTIFRTIYYLPALLSGVVVIFLWKDFYSPDGLITRLYNAIVAMLNFLPGVEIAQVHQNLLDRPSMALFLTLLPVVWAGMGPACLLYLAALKTVPDDLYEAADIDGAGILRKVFSVAVPSIRSLVLINFIGAMIGAVRGAGSFVLAMTGGGPFGEKGGATEVVGLKIFYTTFGAMQFGVGAAMAWVLGSLLVGFTVLQLQRLSRLEFRTAGSAA
jgi:multiple sugar transport system permease protein